jgi:small subunit ribosomal protein S1
MLENAYKNGIPVEGKVEKEIKGGFEVKIGETRGFCPYSQMGFKQKEEPSFYVGKVLPFKISEFKENGRNILVSNRAILEAENQEKMEALKKSLQVGMKVKGTVISLQKYGAFVDVKGFQALLPISEVSRARIDDLSTVLHEGQEIQAEIIKIDWDAERVSLSTKSLEKDPWDEVAEKYSAYDKLDLKISRIADFGLFLEVEPGIDGLLHISEIEDVQANTNLRKTFSVGQTLSIIIKQIDVDAHRISLMQASSKEEDTSAQEFLKSQDDSDTYNPFAALLKK